MIRALSANEVTFTISVEQDDIPVRGNAMASGDDAADRACEDEILRRLDQGDVWAWGFVRVTAKWDVFEASETLGGCCYANEQDFRDGGYFEDLQKEALASLNAQLQEHHAKLQKLEPLAFQLLEEMSASHMVVIRQGDELQDSLQVAVCSNQYTDRGWAIYKHGSLAALVSRAYGGSPPDETAEWDGVSP